MHTDITKRKKKGYINFLFCVEDAYTSQLFNPLGTKPFLVCFLYFYIWAYKLYVMEMEHYVFGIYGFRRP